MRSFAGRSHFGLLPVNEVLSGWGTADAVPLAACNEAVGIHQLNRMKSITTTPVHPKGGVWLKKRSLHMK